MLCINPARSLPIPGTTTRGPLRWRGAKSLTAAESADERLIESATDDLLPLLACGDVSAARAFLARSPRGVDRAAAAVRRSLIRLIDELARHRQITREARENALRSLDRLMPGPDVASDASATFGRPTAVPSEPGEHEGGVALSYDGTTLMARIEGPATSERAMRMAAHAVLASVDRARPQVVTIDLRDVRVLPTAAAAACLDLERALHARRLRVVLGGVRGELMTIVRLLRLDRAFDGVRTLAA